MHSYLAKESFKGNSVLENLSDAFKVVFYETYKNSIWRQTSPLGLQQIKALCKHLVEEKGMFDLLPSQQEALQKGLLDFQKTTVVVQMPTSAGKTILAELRMLQTLAFNPDAKIIYIAPTKALVNQITNDLRADFLGIENNGKKISVEKTSATNEVDPKEDLFLKDDINVLVSTPEKIDLLIRKKTQISTEYFFRYCR
jgi:replicative superfamily II helicase